MRSTRIEGVAAASGDEPRPNRLAVVAGVEKVKGVWITPLGVQEIQDRSARSMAPAIAA